MPDEHLTSDEDVEKILRIAVNLPGGTGTADLRERLQAAADEMGISPEQLAEAERQYVSEKDHKEAMAVYVKEQRSNFVSNLTSFLVFASLFIFWDWNGDHSLNWFWWPTFPWAIAVLVHGWNVINRKSEIYTKDFEKWKKRRDRKRGKKAVDEIVNDLDASIEEVQNLRGVNIIVGNKLIKPKLEVTDWTRETPKEEPEENQAFE